MAGELSHCQLIEANPCAVNVNEGKGPKVLDNATNRMRVGCEMPEALLNLLQEPLTSACHDIHVQVRLLAVGVSKLDNSPVLGQTMSSEARHDRSDWFVV